MNKQKITKLVVVYFILVLFLGVIDMSMSLDENIDLLRNYISGIRILSTVAFINQSLIASAYHLLAIVGSVVALILVFFSRKDYSKMFFNLQVATLVTYVTKTVLNVLAIVFVCVNGTTVKNGNGMLTELIDLYLLNPFIFTTTIVLLGGAMAFSIANVKDNS